jgi:hypothetical protein
MKKLLIMLSVFFSVTAGAQDTTILNGWTIVDSRDSLLLQMHRAAFQSRPKPTNYYGQFVFADTTLPSAQPDTVKVLILVCDTASFGDVVLAYSGSNEIKTSPLYHYTVLWQRGYSINKYNTTTTYLDADKKPLAQNIVVWMVK